VTLFGFLKENHKKESYPGPDAQAAPGILVFENTGEVIHAEKLLKKSWGYGNRQGAAAICTFGRRLAPKILSDHCLSLSPTHHPLASKDPGRARCRGRAVHYGNLRKTGSQMREAGPVCPNLLIKICLIVPESSPDLC